MTTVTNMGQRKAKRLIDKYLRHRVLRGELHTSSAEVIGKVLRQWAGFTGWTAPKHWTTDQVGEWVNDETVRPSTRKSRLTKLRPYCEWLVLEGHLRSDPCLGMARIRIPEGEPRDLTVEEVSQLIAACPDDRARLIVVLMAQLGLRVGDVARIRIEDIDRRRQRLHVRAKGGRGERTHSVPITTEAWFVLDKWLRAERRSSGPLVRSYQSGRSLRPDTIGDLVTAIMFDAGVKQAGGDGITPHSLRHSCAQHMIDAGADLREVQYMLGHRSERSTEIYLRREPVGLREAMEGRSYLRPSMRIVA